MHVAAIRSGGFVRKSQIPSSKMQYPNSTQRAALLLRDCELNGFGAWDLLFGTLAAGDG